MMRATWSPSFRDDDRALGRCDFVEHAKAFGFEVPGALVRMTVIHLAQGQALDLTDGGSDASASEDPTAEPSHHAAGEEAPLSTNLAGAAAPPPPDPSNTTPAQTYVYVSPGSTMSSNMSRADVPSLVCAPSEALSYSTPCA
jgi:hypothetical protein